MKKCLAWITTHRFWIVLFTLALCIRLVLAFPLAHDWDGFVFKQSALNLLQGVTPYQTVAQNSPTIYPDSDQIMTEQWYGYPPLPLLMFTTPFAVAKLFHISLSPVLANGFLKLPFIFGDLLCAYLVYLMLKEKNTQQAKRAMLLVLFNPLLIWISSAWGMFDIWMINFLLLFILCLKRNLYQYAGICLALSLQIKLFSLFFIPSVFAYVLGLKGTVKQRVQLCIVFLEVSFLLVVPFFLSSPQGFMSQNVLMHLVRPPQGIGIVPMIGYIGRIMDFKSTLPTTIGSFMLLSLVGFFSFSSFFYIKGRVTRLLEILFLIYTATLSYNKVVNEQYFVVSLIFLILLSYLSTKKDLFSSVTLVRVELLTTISVLFASVILGFHFLTFLPPFITTDVLKTSTNYLVYYFSTYFSFLPRYSYPYSFWTYYNAPVTITYLLLLPMMISSMLLILQGIKHVIPTLRKISLPNVYVQIRKPVLIATIIFICGAAGSLFFAREIRQYITNTKVLTPVDLIATNQQPSFPQKPKVGTFYNVWWNNPSHLANVADDAWSKTSLAPLSGYYTSKNSYFVEHIQEMKKTGIDFAVVSYHLYDRERFLTFGKYADKLGFYYAPLIESADALQNNADHAVSPTKSVTPGYKIGSSSEKDMVKAIVSALADTKHSPGKLTRDGKPMVFLYDGHFYFPSWDVDAKKQLADIILREYQKVSADPYALLSEKWGVTVKNENDIIRQYPEDVPTFNNANPKTARPSNDDFKSAFVIAYQEYWTNIRHDVEKSVGSVYLISTYQAQLPSYGNSLFEPADTLATNAFDNEFYYSLSNTWSFWRDVQPAEKVLSVWDQQETDQAARDREKNLPVFLTVNGMYDDTVVRGNIGFSIPGSVDGVSTYDATWHIALKNNPDYVLIATWNEFFEGSAIEPTKEYGDSYLTRTAAWINTFDHAVFAAK